MFNRTVFDDERPWRDLDGGLIMAAITACIGFLIGFDLASRSGLLQTTWQHVAYFLTLNSDYFSWLHSVGWRAYAFWSIPIIFSLLAGSSAFAYFARPREVVKILEGRRFYSGQKAFEEAKKAAAETMKGETLPGFELLPGLTISVRRTLQSIMIVGAQGAGKTVIINNIIKSLVKRGRTKLLIFDPVKGDFSRWVKMAGPKLMLLGITDARSLHWWLGSDILNQDDAQAFADGLIAASKEPIWSDSARAVIVACILKLQAERGQDWSWQELNQLIFLPIQDLHAIAEQYYPPAATLLDPGSKTSSSIMMNLVASAAPIARIAAAWKDLPAERRVSMKVWISKKDSASRLIVQMDQRAGNASAAMARAIVSLLSTYIASLEYKEQYALDTAFVLDEVPQFGRQESLPKLMEIGRSKGVFVVVGFQDFSQIKQLYTAHELEKWDALFSIKIFPQIAGKDSQDFVAGLAGEQTVRYWQRATSGRSGTGAGAITSNISWSQPTRRPVILPSKMATFGKRKDGIEALVFGIGSDCLALKWPFPETPQIRPAHVPAIKKPVNATQTPPLSAVHLSHGDVENQNHEGHPTLPEQAAQSHVTTEENVANEIFSILEAGVSEVNSLQENHGKEPAESADHEVVNEVAGETIIHAITEATGINETLLNAIHEISEVVDEEKGVADTQVKSVKKREKKPRSYGYEVTT